MLECFVRSNNVVDISWYHNNTAVTATGQTWYGASQITESYLVITGLGLADTGTYNCKATLNGQEVTSKDITVEVAGVGFLLANPVLGQDVALPCVVATDKTPTNVVFQKRDSSGSWINIGNNLKYNVEALTSAEALTVQGKLSISGVPGVGQQLVIKAFSADDEGFYKCQMNNQLGGTDKSMVISIQTSQISSDITKLLVEKNKNYIISYKYSGSKEPDIAHLKVDLQANTDSVDANAIFGRTPVEVSIRAGNLVTYSFDVLVRTSVDEDLGMKLASGTPHPQVGSVHITTELATPILVYIYTLDIASSTKHLSAVVGEDLILPCSYSFTTTPGVVTISPTPSQTAPGPEGTGTSTATYASLNTADSGEYQCAIGIAGLSTTVKLDLEVKPVPSVSHPTTSIMLDALDYEYLRCEAEIMPGRMITSTWTYKTNDGNHPTKNWR